MKKTRLACIMLGVLILVGVMMSGVAMAQMSKESIKCETLWWYDNEHYYCQQKEFSEMYMYEGLHVFKTKAECEEALRNSIPDYENFPIKYYDSFDKDKDGNPELVIRQYIREIQKEELEAQQKPIKTFYDSVATLGRPSFGGEEILAWIPSGKLYFSTDEVTDVLKAEGMDCNYKHIRYAIKENGQWRLVDEQIYIAKAAEILKSVNSTKT